MDFTGPAERAVESTAAHYPLALSALVVIVVIGALVFVAVKYIESRVDRSEKRSDERHLNNVIRQDKHIARLERTVFEFKNEVQSLRLKLAEVSGYLRASQQEVFRLRGELAYRDEQIKQYEQNVKSLETRIEDLERRLADPNYSPTRSDEKRLEEIRAQLDATWRQMQ